MSYSEATAYGKYVRFLIELYKNGGMMELVNFLENEDEYTCQKALSYIVQLHAVQEQPPE